MIKQKLVPEKQGILSRDKYEPGYLISTDQFVVGTPSRLMSGYGHEAKTSRSNGGTIYNDAGSGVTWIENQVSLGADGTLLGKQKLEDWLWEQASVEVKHCHSDNGGFTAGMFKNDYKKKGQGQSYAGVGAHHQNARAERAIQTVSWCMQACIGLSMG